MAIKESLLAEFDHEMAATRRLLERIPEDKLAWKPHDKSRSAGSLGAHLGDLLSWTGYILDDSSFDVAAGPPATAERTSRRAILEAFDDSARKARSLLDRSDPEYLAPWTLRRAGQQMFTLPKIAALRNFVFNHIIHHRGQLSVYLRLNDIPVPAVYGPTADEG